MPKNRRLLMAAASTASAAIAFSMAPAAAQAVTPALSSCVGSQCTGHPASSYTCSQDAQVVDQEEIWIGSTDAGNIELKWSPTCHATWARVFAKVASSGYAYIISNNSVPPQPPCQFSTNGNSGCNTVMIDDYHKTSYAMGNIQISHADQTVYTISW